MEKNVSKARFIVPSVVGIFLFMIPIKVDGSWTIAVKIIADWISAIAESILGALALGVGMCLSMVWDKMVMGVGIGLVGIVVLLCLLPLTKGIKD